MAGARRPPLSHSSLIRTIRGLEHDVPAAARPLDRRAGRVLGRGPFPAWYQAPANILESLPDGTHRWFADGRLNSAYLALDRQIEEGRGEQTALIYDSPVTGTQDRYSYLRLRDEVARLAGALRALGVGKGDRVIIYMPMVPQAAMAMLACARLGAVHSVFGGFAPYELALRIDDATPKLVLTASCGLEFDRVIEYKPLVDKALELAIHQPAHVMVWQRPQALARGPRPGLAGLPRRRRAGRSAAGGQRRSAVHHVHLGHHR